MNRPLSHSQRRYGRAYGQNRRSTSRIGSCGAAATMPGSPPGVAIRRRTRLSIYARRRMRPPAARAGGRHPAVPSVARTRARVAGALALALALARRAGLLAVVGGMTGAEPSALVGTTA